MPRCAIVQCRNDSATHNISKGGISFHRFPIHPNIKERWIEVTGRGNWFPTKLSTICSKHFQDTDFILKKHNRRFLKQNAVPTQHIMLLYSQVDIKDPTMSLNADLESMHNKPHSDTQNINPELTSTSTAQQLQLSSQEHQDQECSEIQNVDPGDDIPLEMEIFDESNIEESIKKIGNTTENETFSEKLDADDTEKPKTNNSRKRTRKPKTKSGEKTTIRNLRPDICGIKINFSNVDKFGEQITSLLKRIPRRLCRELQESIVTLVKTATEKHESKTKKNGTASDSRNTKKVKIPITRSEISPTLNTKHKKSKQLVNQEEAVVIDSKTDVRMEEYAPDETTQATELLEAQLGTTSDQRFPSRLQTINTVPKPMTLPIELVGSMDCVKQEVLDSEDSSDECFTEPEQCNEATTTVVDTLNTNLKIDMKETKLIKQEIGRENYF